MQLIDKTFEKALDKKPKTNIFVIAPKLDSILYSQKLKFFCIVTGVQYENRIKRIFPKEVTALYRSDWEITVRLIGKNTTIVLPDGRSEITIRAQDFRRYQFSETTYTALDFEDKQCNE